MIGNPLTTPAATICVAPAAAVLVDVGPSANTKLELSKTVENTTAMLRNITTRFSIS